MPAGHGESGSARSAVAAVFPVPRASASSPSGSPRPDPSPCTTAAALPPLSPDARRHATPTLARPPCDRWRAARGSGGYQRTAPRHCWSAAARPPRSSGRGPASNSASLSQNAPPPNAAFRRDGDDTASLPASRSTDALSRPPLPFPHRRGCGLPDAPNQRRCESPATTRPSPSGLDRPVPSAVRVRAAAPFFLHVLQARRDRRQPLVQLQPRGLQGRAPIVGQRAPHRTTVALERFHLGVV